MSLTEETKTGMVAALEHFRQELKSLRTGRASSSMLDHVQIEVYGTQMRVKEVASVTTPEARVLLITPFDPQTVNAIAKGIDKANLNLRPIVDGNVVRISVPPMDESVRKDMVKQGKKKGEEAKIAVREVRRKQNDAVRKQKADGEIAEDQVKKFEKIIQEQTDKFVKEIDELMQAKEKEIMTV